MPNPIANETQDDFISRCIKETIDDGTAKDNKQAYAICINKWNTELYKNIRKKLGRFIQDV